MTAMTTMSTGLQRPETSGPAAIELRGVHKHFGKVRAVRGVDLTIASGEIVALLGPNGAGKTTTIDMLLGLSQPTDGQVSVYGTHPRQAIERGLVSAVLQTGGLLKDLTVEETARYTASLFATSTPVGEVLRRAGISDIADRRVGKCSGGEQQRLRFAMALLPNPELLILDEPTTGMDVEGRRDFWSAIRKDAEQGRTVLFATHYLEEADGYADRIVLLRQGEIVADGTGSEIKALASGRTVRATVPDVDEGALRAIDGVDSVEVRGDTVLIHSKDSDAVARYLLTSTAARDLEINTRGLEDAFIALTSNDGPSAAAANGTERASSATGGTR
jgi:ABC-2 type transport system ATP-binding protein